MLPWHLYIEAEPVIRNVILISLFSRDDLDEIGLEEPFANRLRSMLHQKGFPVGETYQTEGELEKLIMGIA